MFSCRLDQHAERRNIGGKLFEGPAKIDQAPKIKIILMDIKRRSWNKLLSRTVEFKNNS